MINDIILIMNVALKEVNFWTKDEQNHYWYDVIDITTREIYASPMLIAIYGTYNSLW